MVVTGFLCLCGPEGWRLTSHSSGVGPLADTLTPHWAPTGGVRAPLWQSYPSSFSPVSLRPFAVTQHWEHVSCKHLGPPISQIAFSRLEGKSFLSQGQAHLPVCPITTPVLSRPLRERWGPAGTSQSGGSFYLANVPPPITTSFRTKGFLVLGFIFIPA